MSLRQKLIRLAYMQPQLRGDLLPLLKEGGQKTTWNAFPELSRDGFVAEALYEVGIDADPYVPKDLAVEVKDLPMSTVWRSLRKTFPGRDGRDGPEDMEAENHWDERGPAHVQDLVKYMKSRGSRWAFEPVVIDRQGLVDGRHRLFAARLLGIKKVPVIDVEQYR